MKKFYNIISQNKDKSKTTIFMKGNFFINYIGITETGMEVYILLLERIQHALRYDRKNDSFYQQKWVKIDE